jgi:hypothetical protein
MKTSVQKFVERERSNELNRYFWEFHVDNQYESSCPNDMIIGNQLRSPWKIRHKLQAVVKS